MSNITPGNCFTNTPRNVSNDRSTRPPQMWSRKWSRKWGQSQFCIALIHKPLLGIRRFHFGAHFWIRFRRPSGYLLWALASSPTSLFTRIAYTNQALFFRRKARQPVTQPTARHRETCKLTQPLGNHFLSCKALVFALPSGRPDTYSVNSVGSTYCEMSDLVYL